MPFWSRKKEPKGSSAVVRSVSEGKYNTPAYQEWRTQYDQARTIALAEGRSCGRCIAGVISFSQDPTDQAPCTCKLATQKVNGGTEN